VEKKISKPRPEEVVREFPTVGKYRVRLLRHPRRPAQEPTLDIREYVSADDFEGFTRRGIRLTERAQMDLLRDILKEVLEENGYAKPAPGLLPLS
jgi:hypothetical protein